MSGGRFEIKKRDILGRICTFDTPHGRVITPTLLPVINPNIHLIPPKELKALFKVQMIITNSYIIRKGEKLREKALSEGIHSLVDFNGPIMTDSGTFQSYVHGDINLDPQEIVGFQRDIGVDVGTILDVFSTPDRTYSKAEEDVARTVERARIAHEIKGDMVLATTVQGSIYPELRERCARELSSMKGDFFPIGGVVPLLEDYRYGEIVDLVLASKKGLDISKPVHLFGAGHPMVFALAVAMGCDFFDSSSYAKYAVGGRMMFPNGTGKLDEMEYSPCPCPVCAKYAPDELREMENTERIRRLAEHNLYASFAELRRVKEKISTGTLWELVEERAGTHPKMHDALCHLYSHGDYLETYEPTSKKRFMASRPDGFRRPEVARYRNRLTERYTSREEMIVVLPDGSKPYHMGHGKTIEKIRRKIRAGIAVDTPFGTVPLELDAMYPFAQSLYPVDSTFPHSPTHGRTGRDSAKLIRYQGPETIEMLSEQAKENGKEGQNSDLDISMVRAALDMQFGSKIGTRLVMYDGRNITFKKSRKTGRIRNIFFEKVHVFSINARSGRIILTRDGARILHQNLDFPGYRVVVAEDAIPYVRKGKSVFSRFVVDCDDEIRPGDQVLVVDETDELLAWGKALLNKKEMMDFDNGPAVNVKKGFKEKVTGSPT